MPRFKISNMDCDSCTTGVTATLREVDPNAGIRVSLDRREVAVESKTAEANTLDRALHEAGWKSERLTA